MSQTSRRAFLITASALLVPSVIYGEQSPSPNPTASNYGYLDRYIDILSARSVQALTSPDAFFDADYVASAREQMDTHAKVDGLINDAISYMAALGQFDGCRTLLRRISRPDLAAQIWTDVIRYAWLRHNEQTIRESLTALNEMMPHLTGADRCELRIGMILASACLGRADDASRHFRAAMTSRQTWQRNDAISVYTESMGVLGRIDLALAAAQHLQTPESRLPAIYAALRFLPSGTGSADRKHMLLSAFRTASACRIADFERVNGNPVWIALARDFAALGYVKHANACWERARSFAERCTRPTHVTPRPPADLSTAEILADQLEPAVYARRTDDLGSIRNRLHSIASGMLGQDYYDEVNNKVMWSDYWFASALSSAGMKEQASAIARSAASRFGVGVDLGVRLAHLLDELGARSESRAIRDRVEEDLRGQCADREAFPHEHLLELSTVRTSPTPVLAPADPDEPSPEGTQARANRGSLDIPGGHSVSLRTRGRTSYVFNRPKSRSTAEIQAAILMIPPGGNAQPLAIDVAAKQGWFSLGLRSPGSSLESLGVAALEVIEDIERRVGRKLKWILTGFSAGGYAASYVARQIQERCCGLILQGSSDLVNTNAAYPVVFVLGQSDSNMASAQYHYKVARDGGRTNVYLVSQAGGHAPSTPLSLHRALKLVIESNGKPER